MDRGKSGMTFFPGSIVRSPEVRRQKVLNFQEEIVGSAIEDYIDEKERYLIIKCNDLRLSGDGQHQSINCLRRFMFRR
jgi:hypothetical protein